MLQQERAGRLRPGHRQDAHSVREFVEKAFAETGVKLRWQGEGLSEKGFETGTDRVLVEIDPRYFRPTEVDVLLGDASKARKKLGWTHKTDLAATLRGDGARGSRVGRRGEAAECRIAVPFSLAGKSVWVAGHRGMVGSALSAPAGRRKLRSRDGRRDSVDLTRQGETERWVSETRPDAIFLAAAKVGGILANDTYPADFLYDNLMIEANILEAAHRAHVAKADVPRLELHLSKTRRSADQGGRAPDRAA